MMLSINLVILPTVKKFNTFWRMRVCKFKTLTDTIEPSHKLCKLVNATCPNHQNIISESGPKIRSCMRGIDGFIRVVHLLVYPIYRAVKIFTSILGAHSSTFHLSECLSIKICNVVVQCDLESFDFLVRPVIQMFGTLLDSNIFGNVCEHVNNVNRYQSDISSF